MEKGSDAIGSMVVERRGSQKKERRYSPRQNSSRESQIAGKARPRPIGLAHASDHCCSESRRRRRGLQRAGGVSGAAVGGTASDARAPGACWHCRQSFAAGAPLSAAPTPCSSHHTRGHLPASAASARLTAQAASLSFIRANPSGLVQHTPSTEAPPIPRIACIRPTPLPSHTIPCIATF